MQTFQFPEPGPAGAISEVAFYNSIQDVPMFRLNEFQIHLCQDAGIGSTLLDWDKRLENVNASLAAGDVANATTELYNARLGMFLLFDSVSTVARCLADVVFSINGQPITDFSNDGLLQVHRLLMQRLSNGQAVEILDTLKKKFKRELKVGFPSLFSDDDELQFYANIVRRALLQIQDAQSNATEQSAEISQIDKWLREEMKPENFDFSNPKNAVDSKRRDFEQVCTALAISGIANAELLSAYKFHSRIQYLNQHKNPKQNDKLSSELPG